MFTKKTLNEKYLRNFNKALYAGLCLLFEKSGNFFSQSEGTDRLDPLPFFVFVPLLRIPLIPSTTNILFE